MPRTRNPYLIDHEHAIIVDVEATPTRITEGFETADLKEAKAMLDQWAS